jgi:hypothetical protein
MPEAIQLTATRCVRELDIANVEGIGYYRYVYLHLGISSSGDPIICVHK